jgi:hypothetical protein
MVETGGSGDAGESGRRESDELIATGKQSSSGKADLGSASANDGLSRDQTSDALDAPDEPSSPTQRMSTELPEQEGAPPGNSNPNSREKLSRTPRTVRVPKSVTVEVAAEAPLGPELTSARLGTDRPSTTDELGFQDYARAIARFLTHSDSEPPLTISIQAPWGGGKSSLMRMIQNELDASKREGDPTAKSAAMPSATTERLSVGDVYRVLSEVRPGLEPALPKIPKTTDVATQRVTVWFNAWKYENTNQVWAGLVDAILQQVPERLPWKKREQFWAQLNLKRIGVDHIRQRLHEYVLGLALRTSIGALRATVLAGVTALVFLIPYLTSWFGQRLNPFFGWAVPVSFFSSFAAVKWLAAKLKASSEPVAVVLKDLVDIPKYEEQLGFVHQVERDLTRVLESLPADEGLVIFIDDLDRCTPTKVAAVLEAVNLFLAGDFQSCCFVIGMDTEMVAAALQVAHKDLTERLADGEATPLGWRFMDKFVQLPFVIPPLTIAHRSKLMFSLLGRPHPVEAKPALANQNKAGGDANGSFGDEAEQNLLLRRDSEQFIALATAGVELLGRNPRELKRFINLLRFNYFLRFSRVRQGLPVPPATTLAKWTALTVKWPEHGRWLRHVRDRGISDQKLAEYIPESESRDSWHSEPNHFLLLETLAKRCTRGDDVHAPRRHGVGYDQWQDGLVSLYRFSDKAPSWLEDASLLDFYADLPRSKATGIDESLSGNQNTGFW